MILSDREIRAALDNAQIFINPEPDTALWTSTAIDLTLHSILLAWTPQDRPTGEGEIRFYPARSNFNIKALMEDPHYATKIPIDFTEGYVLRPGEFVLGYTQQRVYLPQRSRLAARVEGKSSLARMGVGVHVTAPIIHAGFGFIADQSEEQEMGSPIQLEIFHVGRIPVVLDVGMPICQLLLEEVRELPLKGYKGKFGDQTAFVFGSGSA